LRKLAVRWTLDHSTAIEDAEPDVPASLDDRAADNWRPLLSIADVVGGHWPSIARDAIAALTNTVGSAEANSIREQLLIALREIFAGCDVDRLFTETIVTALKARDDEPWPLWPGRAGFTAPALGKMLKPYGIKSQTIRIGADTAKGYYLKDFEDAFKRYASGQGVTAVTSLPGNELTGDTAVTSREDVTPSPRRKPVTSKPVSVVTAASNGQVGSVPPNVEERL
jgi:hypothetical protein